MRNHPQEPNLGKIFLINKDLIPKPISPLISGMERNLEILTQQEYVPPDGHVEYLEFMITLD